MPGSGPDRVDPEWDAKVMLILGTIALGIALTCILGFLS